MALYLFNLNIVVCGSTGAAAQLIEGETAHKTFRVTKLLKKKITYSE
jgi:hypothetical protein